MPRDHLKLQIIVLLWGSIAVLGGIDPALNCELGVSWPTALA